MWIELNRSLSARRAWIEIFVKAHQSARNTGVALRKESVDRNRNFASEVAEKVVSLSARRAWIEICPLSWGGGCNLFVALRKESVDRNRNALPVWAKVAVALRKESVDRNFWAGIPHRKWLRRSPQGERG